jgi:HemK-like putative methylase
MIKFLNCKINLSKKVFEPRIETEFWVGKAIKEIKKSTETGSLLNVKVLDIFAGTGCIGIAVLKNIERTRVDFADMSKEAVEQIKINLKLNKISPKRYEIYKSNIFEKLKGRKYNIIFVNPPYVALDRISEVQREVLEKDPKKSLFGGRDGMFWIEKFLKEVKNYLKKSGIFYMEFDPLQKEKIKKILEKENFKFNFYKDQFQKFRWLKAMY